MGIFCFSFKFIIIIIEMKNQKTPYFPIFQMFIFIIFRITENWKYIISPYFVAYIFQNFLFISNCNFMFSFNDRQFTKIHLRENRGKKIAELPTKNNDNRDFWTKINDNHNETGFGFGFFHLFSVGRFFFF